MDNLDLSPNNPPKEEPVFSPLTIKILRSKVFWIILAIVIAIAVIRGK